MPADTRQARILDLLKRRGYAGIDELVAALGVTPQTIRRDLNGLFERGLLRRHHGGASLPSSTANRDYDRRHVEQAVEKSRIADAVTALIAPGSSLFMTPGTTVEAAAAAIAASDLVGLRVVTNSTVAARILGANANIGVTLTGGAWQANNQALAGSSAAESAARYRCDIALTSIGAIDDDGWLLDFREEEVVVAKAMLANARRRVLLADHSKFSAVAACKLARIGEMTTFVTDRTPPRRFETLMTEAGCDLLIAPTRAGASINPNATRL